MKWAQAAVEIMRHYQCTAQNEVSQSVQPTGGLIHLTLLFICGMDLCMYVHKRRLLDVNSCAIYKLAGES